MEDVSTFQDTTMNVSTSSNDNSPNDLRILAQSYLAFKIGKCTDFYFFSFFLKRVISQYILLLANRNSFFRIEHCNYLLF